jgi:phage terminase large subunit-like protein
MTNEENLAIAFYSEAVDDMLFIPQSQQSELDNAGIKTSEISDFPYIIKCKDARNTVIGIKSKEKFLSACRKHSIKKSKYFVGDIITTHDGVRKITRAVAVRGEEMQLFLNIPVDGVSYIY